MTRPHEKKVLSASRRTDIPAFYMEWFMGGIRKKAFTLVNPYTGKRSVLSVTPETVHTIVFWSKNFGPFLEGRYGEQLSEQGFHLFFNFTINANPPLLEPGVPPLKARLAQLEALCKRFGPECITWRFDPICGYTTGGGDLRDNVVGFEPVARHAENAGVQRCVVSFMDFYPKIGKRIEKKGLRATGFAFVDPPLPEKIRILSRMEKTLEESPIRLMACCEKAVLEALPAESRIQAASCIPNDVLMHLFGGRLSLKRDTGQRIKDGCGCRVSVDVGSYRRHPCFHGCLFCYANSA